MNTFNTILIANTAEAFKKVLLEASGTENGKRRIRHELALSQRAFFWAGDNKVVVTPYTIPKILLRHNTKTFGFKNVINLAPKKVEVGLCETIINDTKLWDTLVRTIKANPGVTISPYAVTTDFVKLLHKLKERNLKFRAPELPDSESLWTIAYLDSKSGFRKRVSALSGVRTPQGFVCKDWIQAIHMGQKFMVQKRSCVIKSNVGESGWGTLILKKELFKNLHDFENFVKAKFAEDTIWNHPPLVVEEFIDPLVSIAGGMPSVEAYIDSTGIKMTYTCGQDINDQGEFLGVSIGDKVLPKQFDKKIRAMTEEIGQSFFKLGYRGSFDVDFVLSKEGTPYAIESNTRRTGGTHAYDIKQLLATRNKRVKGSHILSYDSFLYGADVLSPTAILKKSEKVLYPMSGKSEGIIISFSSIDHPVFGYVVIGRNKKHSEALRAGFLNLWPSDSSLGSMKKVR